MTFISMPELRAPRHPRDKAPYGGSRFNNARSDFDRHRSNEAMIWRLCGKAACLRAQACRGCAADCLERCIPLVPREVMTIVDGWLRAEHQGIDPDQVVARHEREFAVYSAWTEAVAASFHAPLR